MSTVCAEQESLLFDAIDYLESILTSRKKEKDGCSIVVKLLAIRLNAIVGNLTRSIEIFKSMDVKNIQLEATMHFIHDTLLYLPNHYPYYAKSLWMLYESNEKDVSFPKNLPPPPYFKLDHLLLDFGYAGECLCKGSLFKGKFLSSL